jgi:four helix bundle protein
MTEKEIFIEKLKERTKVTAALVIKFCDTLNVCKASAVVTYQIVKSATSIGANYRAACRARSKQEFFSKMCIVVEEADETQYWLEIIEESKLSKDKELLKVLKDEIIEITKIMTSAKNTLYEKKDHN